MLVVTASSCQGLSWLVNAQGPLGTSVHYLSWQAAENLGRDSVSSYSCPSSPSYSFPLTLPVPSASCPPLPTLPEIDFPHCLNHSFFLAIFVLIPKLAAPVISSLQNEVMVGLVKGMFKV